MQTTEWPLHLPRVWTMSAGMLVAVKSAPADWRRAGRSAPAPEPEQAQLSPPVTCHRAALGPTAMLNSHTHAQPDQEASTLL